MVTGTVRCGEYPQVAWRATTCVDPRRSPTSTAALVLKTSNPSVEYDVHVQIATMPACIWQRDAVFGCPTSLIRIGYMARISAPWLPYWDPTYSTVKDSVQLFDV
jgi:hypothetical protein